VSQQFLPLDHVTLVRDGTAVLLTPKANLPSASYEFTFELRNQEQGQTTAPVLSFQAAYVSNSAVTVGQLGASQEARWRPMYIVAPIIGSNTNVHQSSDFPCAINTISITISINVPLYQLCAPRITFTGLTASSSDKSTDITSLAILYAGSPRPSPNLILWSRQDGKLVLAPNSTDSNDPLGGLIGPLSDLNSDGADHFVVKFNLVNPSKYQDAPGMDVSIQYTNAADTYVWQREAPGTLLGAVDSVSSYPMKIANAAVRSRIFQSSPFACDQNTITITFSANVDMNARCNPFFSLTGLTGPVNSAGRYNVSVVYKTYSWVRDGLWSSGNLKLNITTPGIIIEKDEPVTLQIVLKNPNVAQASPGSSLALRVILDDPYNEESSHGDTTDGYASASNGAIVFATDTSSLTDWNLKMGAECAPALEDTQPLKIRSTGFSAESSISSTTNNPCAPNGITLSIKTSSPVFKACISTLTITGLTNTKTDTGILNLAGGLLLIQEHVSHTSLNRH
jgi:hypothetical protein